MKGAIIIIIINVPAYKPTFSVILCPNILKSKQIIRDPNASKSAKNV
jgi:hypothetical protein